MPARTPQSSQNFAPESPCTQNSLTMFSFLKKKILVQWPLRRPNLVILGFRGANYGTISQRTSIENSRRTKIGLEVEAGQGSKGKFILHSFPFEHCPSVSDGNEIFTQNMRVGKIMCQSLVLFFLLQLISEPFRNDT